MGVAYELMHLDYEYIPRRLHRFAMFMCDMICIVVVRAPNSILFIVLDPYERRPYFLNITAVSMPTVHAPPTWNILICFEPPRITTITHKRSRKKPYYDVMVVLEQRAQDPSPGGDFRAERLLFFVFSGEW